MIEPGIAHHGLFRAGQEDLEPAAVASLSGREREKEILIDGLPS